MTAIDRQATARVILELVACSTRAEAATVCAPWIGQRVIDWPAVNGYLLSRWSMSSVDHIKRLAWKSLEVSS